MFAGITLAEMLPYVAVGFAAQLVDGALGMAFGVISSTLLVSVLGIAPATASAGVHLVETMTTGVSGLSHVLHRNVNWRLFARLLIPGMIGGVLGAYVLTSLDASVTRPFVMAYLSAIGLYLLFRAIRFAPHNREPKIVEPLGLAGGFLDAAGGGGWGPVVTSNLLVQGAQPRTTIGTVNTTEFFLTLTISATFLFHIGAKGFTPEFWHPVLGLLIGGVVAAPFGAMFAKRVPTRVLLSLVGVVLTATSAFSLYRALV
ncbi:sulfite exporter TauE/SafE family protein [Sphingomonas pituitosa]|uniref:sulfite exporter TauE/SafE family protein n=1 Tax=Sphingomonas pituitosa TaxID=99597 RepID=UPI0008298AE4|nr:sulfite exporter TauE/SafE family protein [Sphingomonas pituitosa]